MDQTIILKLRNILFGYNEPENTLCISVSKYSNTTDVNKSKLSKQDTYIVNGNLKECQQNIKNESSDKGSNYGNYKKASHLTVTDVKNDLARYYIPIKNSKFTNYIKTTCSSCLEVRKRAFEGCRIINLLVYYFPLDQLDSDLYDSKPKFLLRTTNKGFGIYRKKPDEKQEVKDKVNESLSKNEEEYYSDPAILKIWNKLHEIPDTLDYNVNLCFKLFNKYLGIDRYRNSRNPTNPIGIKIIRQTVDGKLTKEKYPLNENKHSEIFCYHLITESDKEVFLTTNERDSMAINEAECSSIVLSLPKVHILDYSIIPYFQRFEKIYF
uniref:Twinkle protein, mitochondrial (inferred by orthology to a human protein) n=1 Tax=Strongyloides venezuelensis TaxID=75913 RepID=A0A0K0EYE1_STRVS